MHQCSLQRRPCSLRVPQCRPHSGRVHAYRRGTVAACSARVSDVLVLDFDGVLVDSEKEVGHMR